MQGEEWQMMLQDTRTDPEPGLPELPTLGRGKPPKIVPVQPASSVKAPLGLKHLPPEGSRLPLPGLSSGQQPVYPEEG